MKSLRYFCDFNFFDRQDNLLTWALSHNFNLIFDEISPDIVFTGNDLSPDLIKYKNSKIIYYTGEPFLSWSGDINRNVIDKALTFFNFEDSFFDRVPLILHYNYEYYKNGYIDDYEFLLNKRAKTTTVPTKFCSFVSRGDGYPCCPRKYFFEKLSSYKTVNSHGAYLNNSEIIPIGDTSKFENSLFKVKCISNYKFNICFENSYGCTKSPIDYTYVNDSGLLSEKIYEALLSNTVPIYWGNKDISKDLNTKSFVNYYDYDDFDSMIEKIIEIDNNDDLFLEYVNQDYVLDKRNSIFEREYIIELMKNICN
jgi:hypothetical protein